MFTNVSGTETETLSNVDVAVEDQYGNVLTGDTSSVTLSLNAAASGGSRALYNGSTTGSVTAPVVNGVATFSGLSIVNPANPNYGAAGTGYSLSASDTDNGSPLTTATSTAFNTTLIVTNVTMTPTGFVATFSQPLNANELNLYGRSPPATCRPT